MRLGLAVVLACGSAVAEPSSIEAGLEAYQALDYERAVALLRQAFSESLDVTQKTIVLRTLAFAHVALDAEDQARAEFRLLLRIDPKVALDETVSPRVRLIFEEARSEIAPLVVAPAPSPAPVLLAAPTPPPPRRPLWRRGWVWGTAAGATATVILVGVLAGVLSEPSTARVTIAHP